MSAAAACAFCDIIRGAAEVSVCHEDATTIAFMDIQPVNNGHVLVSSREHYADLSDTPPDVAMQLFAVALQLAPIVRRITGAKGLNIVVNSGAAAGQNVPHHHVHLIPRYAGDGFDIALPFPGSPMPDRLVLDATAARIIAATRDPMLRSARPVSPAGA